MISGTPRPFSRANQRTCTAAMNDNNQEHGATQLGIPLANPFKEKLISLERGYSKTYIGTTIIIHTGIITMNPQRRRPSTDIPERL